MTAAKYLNLTPKEAWAKYVYVRPDLYQGHMLREIYEANAARLMELPIGSPFRASELRVKWDMRGVGTIVERALRFGLVTYDGIRNGERVYRRVK